MSRVHTPSFALQLLSVRPAVVCAVLVTLGLGLHLWHTGWLGDGSGGVTPASQVVRLHGFPSPESQRILVRGATPDLHVKLAKIAMTLAAACRELSRVSSPQPAVGMPVAAKP